MSDHGAVTSGQPSGSGPRGPMRGRGPMGGGPMGPMGGMMKGEKPKDFKGTMRKLIGYLGAYKIAIAVILVVSAGSTVFSIVGPKILGNATTKLFEGVVAKIAGTGSIDFPAIGRIILTVLGLYVLSSAFGYVQGWVMADVSMKITYRLRRDIAEKINRMPLRYFDGTNHGEVLSLVSNDVDTVNRTLSQSLTQIVSSAATVIGVLVMMISISSSWGSS
jgi:ATP-binding cassette subfamily B multidrug efflux pump